MSRARGLRPVCGPTTALLLATVSLAGVRPPAQPVDSSRAIRVGLADAASAARVSAPSPFVLRAGELRIEVADALISPETGESGESVLALGSFADRAAAREAAERFAGTSPDAATVRTVRLPASGRFLVALDEGSDPVDVERLRALGFASAALFPVPSPVGDALVVRPLGGSPIRIPGGAALTAEPRPGEFLEWDGDPYRGTLEFARGEAGVRVVNRVDLEDYLAGVVPRELPPELFPEIEALKAQALAARTYALTPRPVYRERGYDLCATPACQVYGGVAAERPLSTRAVRETEGEVLLHDGELIDALYTAACGGSTENAENVFSTPTPYLVARPGRREPGGLRVAGADPLPLEAGVARIGAELPEPWRRDLSMAPVLAPDARRVFGGALDWMGFARCDAADAPTGPLSLGGFADLVEALRCRPAPGAGGAAAPASVATDGPPSLGRLIAEGLLPAAGLSADPDRALAPRDVVHAAAAVLRLEGDLLRRALVRRFSGDGVLVEPETDPGEDPVLHELRTVPGALLYREVRPTRIPGRDEPRSAPIPAAALRLRPGDFVRYRPLPGSDGAPVSGDGTPVRADLLILEELGESLDRFSSQESWLVPKNNVDLSARIARLEGRPLGEIVALEPLEHGPSGRVTRLLVRGTAGELELERFSIRTRLGLSENLFSAEPRRDASGRITEWWFRGRGWGHGLGLCQAGAYGMATAGATYREILAHYYPGTGIATR